MALWARKASVVKAATSSADPTAARTCFELTCNFLYHASDWLLREHGA